MWKYNGKDFTSDMIGDNRGFVYIIKNLTTGKSYIGKKLFQQTKRYQKNKKVKRKLIESDWKEYTGSNSTLNEDVQNGHTLDKEILHLCKSKGWMSYFETQEILNRDAIQRDDYYNEWVSCKIRRSHLS